MAEPEQQQHPKRKYWILAIVAVVIVVYIVAQYFGPYARLKRQVRAGDTVKHLSEWGVTVLEHPPVGEKTDVLLDLKTLPDFVQGLPSLISASYVKGKGGMDEHLNITCGNRYYHYGLEIGRPGFKPAEIEQFLYEPLGDGVWGYSPAEADKGGGE